MPPPPPRHRLLMEGDQRRSPSLLCDFNKCILGREEEEKERRGDRGREVCAAGRRTKTEMESRGNCKVNATKRFWRAVPRAVIDSWTSANSARFLHFEFEARKRNICSSSCRLSLSVWASTLLPLSPPSFLPSPSHFLTHIPTRSSPPPPPSERRTRRPLESPPKGRGVRPRAPQNAGAPCTSFRQMQPQNKRRRRRAVVISSLLRQLVSQPVSHRQHLPTFQGTLTGARAD